MCRINIGSGSVSYETVRQAMNGAPYTMSLTGPCDIQAVVAAVNQGIDSHLEACYCPERGDRYGGGQREAGKLVLCRTLECTISVESLPVLLRRLCELDLNDPPVEEEGMSLASNILETLGINEYGKYVGRAALGFG